MEEEDDDDKEEEEEADDLVHGPPRGRCSEPRQEGLWSRLVAPTGTNRHPRVSISVAGVFVFFKGGVWGFWGVNLGVSYIVLAS